MHAGVWKLPKRFLEAMRPAGPDDRTVMKKGAIATSVSKRWQVIYGQCREEDMMERDKQMRYYQKDMVFVYDIQ